MNSIASVGTYTNITTKRAMHTASDSHDMLLHARHGMPTASSLLAVLFVPDQLLCSCCLLPALLAVLAALERGQSSATILEGHMPGSCWALTRRIVQQLLLDRGQVPLTLLVQRLDATLAVSAGSDSSNGGKIMQ